MKSLKEIKDGFRDFVLKYPYLSLFIVCSALLLTTQLMLVIRYGLKSKDDSFVVACSPFNTKLYVVDYLTHTRRYNCTSDFAWDSDATLTTGRVVVASNLTVQQAVNCSLVYANNTRHTCMLSGEKLSYHPDNDTGAIVPIAPADSYDRTEYVASILIIVAMALLLVATIGILHEHGKLFNGNLQRDYNSRTDEINQRLEKSFTYAQTDFGSSISDNNSDVNEILLYDLNKPPSDNNNNNVR